MHLAHWTNLLCPVHYRVHTLPSVGSYNGPSGLQSRTGQWSERVEPGLDPIQLANNNAFAIKQIQSTIYYLTQIKYSNRQSKSALFYRLVRGKKQTGRER